MSQNLSKFCNRFKRQTLFAWEHAHTRTHTHIYDYLCVYVFGSKLSRCEFRVIILNLEILCNLKRLEDESEVKKKDKHFMGLNLSSWLFVLAEDKNHVLYLSINKDLMTTKSQCASLIVFQILYFDVNIPTFQLVSSMNSECFEMFW